MNIDPDNAESLLARLDELEAEVRTLRTELAGDPETVSRRRMLGMLKGLAAATAGAVVTSSVLGAEPADATAVSTGAADGDALQIGGANVGSGGNATRLTASLSANPTSKSTNSSSSGTPGGFQGIQSSADAGVTGGYGVQGQANADTAIGVHGQHIGSGVGVRGNSFLGAGIHVQDRVDAFGGSTTVMPPTAGTWATGSLVNSAGQLWHCYVAGVGSASKWVRLSASFVPVTPTRVYDSRAAAPSPGILAAGSNRLISVADGRDSAGAVLTPNIVAAGATAVTANITVTGTTGVFGYLAINPGGNTVEGASTINWFGVGQTIANGVTLTLNASRQLTVICNGIAGASTHFIVDVSGYYL